MVHLQLLRKRSLLSGFILLILVGVAGVVAIGIRPDWGAKGAMLLRPIIGNEGVSRLEQVYFNLEDRGKQIQHEWGLAEAAPPWEITPAATASITPIPTTPTPTATAAANPTDPSAQLQATAEPSPTAPPSPTPWRPAPATPLGNLAGEADWNVYLTNPAGEPVAYRTFLQPDLERPYAIAAIVAFDLTETRLHFMLGTEEPGLTDNPQRGQGWIPEADRQPGHLLATFNGGFLTTHGRWGAGQGALEVVPPRDGFMTVAIHDDGRVQIGEWGRDILTSDNMAAWRQNGRPVVQAGQIHERVYSNAIADWGAALSGDIVTWRSGLAISDDGQTLYYVAGPGLSMPALASVMVHAGAAQGMLLDINKSWVHFAAITATDNQLTAAPLFPDDMGHQPDRYLRVSARDFFYVTLRPAE
jgi:hypothetical protein